jgi:hypothetical protein
MEGVAMMKQKLWAASSALLTCLVLMSGTSAQAADEKEKKIESKGKQKVSAAVIDFAADLGLNLAALNRLGARIDQARSEPDPVGLAGAARLLGVAEKVSGKTAKIKAADLMKEAVEMAQRRDRPEELKALALMTRDPKVSKTLNDQAAKAEKVQQDLKNGEKTRGIEERLYVVNKTGYYIRVFLDYRYVGTVYPYHTATMWVGAAPFTTTRLSGDAPGTTITWGPTLIPQRASTYTWTLY